MPILPLRSSGRQFTNLKSPIIRIIQRLQRGPIKMSMSKKDLGNLSPVTQEKHTERPFTGKFNQFKQQGTYERVVCSQELFKSNHKFESGCGWPAFYDSLDPRR